MTRLRTARVVLRRATLVRTRRAAPHALRVALLAALTPALLAAQEEPASADRWQTALELALTAAAGNESFVIATSGLQVRHVETTRYELELDTQLRYGTSEGRTIARRAQAGLKFDLQPAARWSPFALALVEHDALRSLDMRLQSGAGAKYTFQRSEQTELSLSLALLYDREDLEDLPTAHFARWSWRARAVRELRSGVRLQHTTFYQPVWDEPGDYLIRAQTGVSTRITDVVALTITHSFDRDATPPPDVGENDHLVKVGLRFEF